MEKKKNKEEKSREKKIMRLNRIKIKKFLKIKGENKKKTAQLARTLE